MGLHWKEPQTNNEVQPFLETLLSVATYLLLSICSIQVDGVACQTNLLLLLLGWRGCSLEAAKTHAALSEKIKGRAGRFGVGVLVRCGRGRAEGGGVEWGVRRGRGGVRREGGGEGGGAYASWLELEGGD